MGVLDISTVSHQGRVINTSYLPSPSDNPCANPEVQFLLNVGSFGAIAKYKTPSARTVYVPTPKKFSSYSQDVLNTQHCHWESQTVPLSAYHH